MKKLLNPYSAIMPKKKLLSFVLSVFCLTTVFINFSVNKAHALPKNYTVYYYINKFTQKNSSRYLTVDKIYWVTDFHHDDDYYIINKNKKLRTYKISSKAKFYIVDFSNSINPSKKVNYSEFKAHISERYHAVIKLKFSGKQVVEAREIYTP